MIYEERTLHVGDTFTYKGTTYTSKSELESALKENGVTCGSYMFDLTMLSN